MCGIAGIYNFRNHEAVDRGLLKSMTDTLVHRGPDEEGLFLSGPVGLGHRRLSIIDLASGQQPMANEDKTVWVAFNGEIYDFAALRADLVGKGHVFQNRSDTEVIVHLYEELGEKCLEKLRGMFAIAIWDERKQKLILARDRVGKKPLYYYYDGSRVVFASEIKAILEAPGVTRDVDLQAFSDYLSFLYIPAPKSIFKNLFKVLPGHYVTVTPSGLSESEYWDISFAETDNYSEAEWRERILDVYREAVRLRLVSEVPLGAFLSGGVDSSSVVALMDGAMDKPVITSSIGFEETEFNELPYAREMAAKFHTDHHEQIVRADAVSVVEKLSWHYDEPFADSSAVPTYYVSQIARQHVTVALSGDGGDEHFAGYRRYQFDQRENWLRERLPASVRRPMFGALASLYPKADWAPRFLRGKSTFESLARCHIDGYFHSVSACRPVVKAELLHPDVTRQLAGYDSLDVLRHYYDKADSDDPLSRIQYVDIKTYLTDDILAKVDRASMANSLEVRAPILDHKLMELVARIPSRLKLRGGEGKYIFKRALEAYLPQNILYRKKMGFAVPLARWFRKELSEMARATIFDPPDDGYLNRRTLQKLWSEHQGGMRDRSTELWVVLMFRLWQRQFQTSSAVH